MKVFWCSRWTFDEPADIVVAEFRDELGLTFDLLLDPGAEVQELYRNRNYPSTFFVDENGVIQVQHIGVMTEGQLDAELSCNWVRELAGIRTDHQAVAKGCPSWDSPNRLS